MNKWLFSRQNLVACGVAALGLVLFLLGVIDKFWWLITLGLYAGTYFLVGKEKPQDITFQYAQAFEGSQTQLEALIAQHTGELPVEANKALASMLINLKDLNSFIVKNEDNLLPTPEFYSIKSLFKSYIPTIVSKYTQLPANYANTAVIKDGKTTKDFLVEQLNLLNTHFEKMTHSIYEHDSQALVVHGQFLKNKFEKPEFEGFDILSGVGLKTETAGEAVENKKSMALDK